jgi:hypothetical protein
MVIRDKRVLRGICSEILKRTGYDILINKDFDQENIELIISKINKNKNLKKIISLILIAISILGVIIYIKK